jgi:hypothetical protein
MLLFLSYLHTTQTVVCRHRHSHTATRRFTRPSVSGTYIRLITYHGIGSQKFHFIGGLTVFKHTSLFTSRKYRSTENPRSSVISVLYSTLHRPFSNSVHTKHKSCRVADYLDRTPTNFRGQVPHAPRGPNSELEKATSSRRSPYGPSGPLHIVSSEPACVVKFTGGDFQAA